MHEFAVHCTHDDKEAVIKYVLNIEAYICVGWVYFFKAQSWDLVLSWAI